MSPFKSLALNNAFFDFAVPMRRLMFWLSFFLSQPQKILQLRTFLQTIFSSYKKLTKKTIHLLISDKYTFSKGVFKVMTHLT